MRVNSETLKLNSRSCVPRGFSNLPTRPECFVRVFSDNRVSEDFSLLCTIKIKIEKRN